MRRLLALVGLAACSGGGEPSPPPSHLQQVIVSTNSPYDQRFAWTTFADAETILGLDQQLDHVHVQFHLAPGRRAADVKARLAGRLGDDFEVLDQCDLDPATGAAARLTAGGGARCRRP